MDLPTIEQIVEIHREALNRYGGEKGILNRDQLLSFEDIMGFAFNIGGKNKLELAAWILVRLIQNHYFIDGNKRTALGTMLNFLKSNGCVWRLPNKEYFYHLTMNIAKKIGEVSIENVENKLKKVIICE